MMMTVYVIERDNPDTRPEPEVTFNGAGALQVVREEYEECMRALGTSQEEADAGNGNYGCYFEFDGYEGTALIEEDNGTDRWEWRVTTHVLDTAYLPSKI